VAEQVDQGWFYSQLVTGVVAFGKSPYESVLMHGWALTPTGEAMSKSEGTAIDPVQVVNSLGADSLRLYLLKANAPWEDVAFQQEGVKAANRTLNILWNVYKFASLYMSIDNFDPSVTHMDSVAEYLRPEDRWMLSRIESLKKETTDALEVYELHRASRALEDFVVTDLSRWYVKLVRDRLWKEGEDKDKLAAFKVLHEALSTATALLAPFAPHITDSIFSNLCGRPESVHMASWPTQNSSLIDPKLEESMNLVREISEIVARIRQEASMNLRWPIKKIVIKAQTAEVMESLKILKDPLLSQNNIKDLQTVPAGEEWDEMMLSVEPNPNAIGKVYRQWSSKIAILLKNRPAKTIKAGIDKGEYSLGIEGQLVKILPNMVSFTSTLPPDVAGADFSKGVIYVDLERTPELEAEGLSREIIRRIQQMRKDMKLDVEEFVKVEIQCSRKVEGAVESWKEKIARETRAKQFDVVDASKGQYIVEWNVDTEAIVIGISPLTVKKNIDAISQISGITREKAMKLYDAGYNSMESLKEAEPEDLVIVEGITRSDARRVCEHFRRKEEKPVAPPVTVQPEQEVAPTPPPIQPQETPPEELAPAAVQETPAPGPAALVAPPTPPPQPPAAAPKAPEPALAQDFRETLMAIDGIDAKSASSVYEAGFQSAQSIKMASAPDLAKVAGISEPAAVLLVEHFIGVKTEPARAPAAPVAGVKPAGGVVDLERSFSYLVEEDKPDTSYSLFINALKKGMKGYCITRNYPAKIRSKFDLKDTPIIWLSNVGRESTIRPKDLEKLSLSLEQFLSQPGGGIVLLDGLEYLITNNNFITVLRLIQSLRDQVAINQSILLMAVNRSTLETHQLNLLEREVDYTISG